MLTFEQIRQKAFSLGWDDMGVTEPTISDHDKKAFLAWLKEGRHGSLTYMENELRLSPEKLLPGAKSVCIFVTYYKQKKKDFQLDQGVIAGYARGRDYHHVHKKRLKKMIFWLEEVSGEVGIAKGFSDSSPILEKAFAAQAGVGWLGKNTLLIHRRFGTFILLSGLITTLEIQGRVLPTNLPKCGSCTKCMDACPTQALIQPYQLDATKCLSYHLIESKEAIPEEIREKNPGYIFGCDICQDVCPHNVRKPLSTHSEFAPENGIGEYLDENGLKLLEENPEKLHGTPLQRKKVAGLMENARSLGLMR